MNRQKRSALLLIGLFCLVLLVGCGRSTLIGTWKHDSLGAAYEFTEDLQVIITLAEQNPVYGSYTFDEPTKTLVVTYEGQQQSGIVEISRKKLRITSPDSGAVITLTRLR